MFLLLSCITSGSVFYQYPADSLEHVCKKHKVNPNQLIAELESWAMHQEPTPEQLYLNPIEVLVAYLKKKHYYFVRQELPFLSNMISGVKPEPGFEALMADLKIMFPLFVEDFIHHIHEEESRLFKRIELLQDVEDGNFALHDAVTILEKDPVRLLAEQHEIHDDEMERGFEKLTNDYSLEESAPLTMKVLFFMSFKILKGNSPSMLRSKMNYFFPRPWNWRGKFLGRIYQKIRTN